MDKRLLGYINWALLACMLLLYFTGVANLYSASGTRVETGFAFESFYQRQMVWGLCGLGCMLLATLFDYRQLRNLAWPAYLIFLVLLMLVPLVGSTFYGAKRWISFGLFTIQPSEPIKIAVLILVARLLARDSQPLGWKNFFSVLAVGLVPVVFILKQPDLGTAMMVLLIMGGMILGARRPLAAEYSFIAAVPIMVAATGFDLLKSLHLFTAADIPFFAVGMIGSFISALIAVKAFVRLVGHMTLVPFAVYRLLLAPFIWYFMVH